MGQLGAAVFVILLLVPLVNAQGECFTISSTNTEEFFEELPSLDSQLSSCEITIPPKTKMVLNNKNLLVEVSTDTEIRSFYLAVNDLKLASLKEGIPEKHSYKASLNEDTMDKILQSENMMQEILEGIKNKEIKVSSKGFGSGIVWFVAKFFLVG